jgi:predicted RNA-binding Zn ribbon-like protein
MSPVPPDEPGLRLAIAFVNTYDLLADPPDRLTLDVAGKLADRHGRPDLASGLPDSDIGRLRELRALLYAVFAGESDAAKVAALNAVLERVDARARFLAEGRLAVMARDDDPVDRLGALCADALARAMAIGGPGRLGTCAGHPCRCGYVDRTRAGRQRFCCELCNDRAAAAAYRSRHA